MSGFAPHPAVRFANAVEQARTKKVVLEGYTKAKVIGGLVAQVEKARAIELVKKAAYDQLRAAGTSGPSGAT